MDRSAAQLGLFGSLEGFPEGFSYEENILSLEEERTLVRAFAGLPLKAFEFQGFQGKRRVVSFGLHYDFNTRGLGSAEAIPEFMMALREKAAGFAEVSAEALQHVLVTEYAPGAGIGWHQRPPGVRHHHRRLAGGTLSLQTAPQGSARQMGACFAYCTAPFDLSDAGHCAS